jgi:hypothetical protein
MQPRKNHKTLFFCRILVVFLCMSLSTGCTTLKPLPYTDSQSALSLIKPGDEIQLTTRDGKVREFTVKEATAQQLIGESENVNISDITFIEKREFSGWKTSGLTVGLFFIGIFILGAIAVANMGP